MRAANYCNRTLDIAFLIDDSSSIQKSDWQLFTQFLGTVMNNLYIAPYAVRVALVEYDSNAKLVFGLNQYQTSAQVGHGVM